MDGFAELTDITYHRHITDATVRVAFNRPEVRNAFRPHTVDELDEAVEGRDAFLAEARSRLRPVPAILLIYGEQFPPNRINASLNQAARWPPRVCWASLPVGEVGGRFSMNAAIPSD